MNCGCCSGNIDLDIEEVSSSSIIFPLDKAKETNKCLLNPKNELISFGAHSFPSPFDLNKLIVKPTLPIQLNKIAFGDSHSLMLFTCEEKSYLAASGSNDNGQLGFEYSSFKETEVKYNTWTIIDIEKLVNQPNQLWSKFECKIKDIAAGSDYSLVLVEVLPAKTQILYRFQFSKEDQYDFIAPRDDLLYKKNPVHEENFPFKKDIKQIASYNERIMVLMEDNSLYIKGILYDMSFSLNKFKLYTKLSVEILDITMGINHTLLVGENDVIYCLGHNEYAEFGMGNEKKFGLVTEQTFFRDNKLVIDKVSTGGRHTLVLCQGGKVFCFGDNSDRQCTDYDKVILAPTEMRFDCFYPIIDVCCGLNHSFARSSKGIVYGWGNNSEGKLGFEENRTKPNKPIEILSLKTRNVTSMFAGKSESVFFVKIFEEKKVLIIEKDIL